MERETLRERRERKFMENPMENSWKIHGKSNQEKYNT